MPALWLWFNLLPPVVRRLIGAVLIGGAVLVSGLVVYKRHVSGIKHEYFNKGYTVAHDSAVEATILRLAAQHAKDTLRAATSAKAAQDGTTALIPQRASFDSAVAKRPTGLRLEALPDSFAHVPATDKVRVIVASTGDTVDDVPRLAAQYWFRTDSLLGIAKTLLDKYAAANRQWAAAWQDENAARIGADSLTAMYAERLRSQTVPPAAKSHRLVYLTLGVVAGAVLHNQFHRTPNSVSTSRSVVVAAKRLR